MAILTHFYLDGTQGEDSVLLDVLTFKSFAELLNGVAKAFSIAKPDCKKNQSLKENQGRVS